jgi:hypothetical protein
MKTRKPKLDFKNLVANCGKKKRGVKSETSKKHGSHSWFETDTFLFDPNDFQGWTEYNFHNKSNKDRPLTKRKSPFNNGYQDTGVCHLIANALSNYWYDIDRNDPNNKKIKIKKLITMSKENLLNYI